MNNIIHKCFVVFLVAGCGLVVSPALAEAGFKGPSEAIQADVAQAVLQTNDKMNAAACRLDAEALFRFILDTDKGLIVQNGVVFKTRAEALAAVKRGFRGIAKMERRFENPQVTVLSADAALLTADGRVNATLDDGRPLASTFAVSVVFVRQDGEWKVLHGHYSIPMPAGQ